MRQAWLTSNSESVQSNLRNVNMWLVLFVWTNRRQIVEFVCVFALIFQLVLTNGRATGRWALVRRYLHRSIMQSLRQSISLYHCHSTPPYWTLTSSLPDAGIPNCVMNMFALNKNNCFYIGCVKLDKTPAVFLLGQYLLFTSQ
jgi:hypothetical protein